VLIEIEGGIYIQGRHHWPQGFAADAEKYLEAAPGRLARPATAGASDHRPTVECIICFVGTPSVKSV